MLNVDQGKFDYNSNDQRIRRASKAVCALSDALWIELRTFGHEFPTDSDQFWLERNNENADAWAEMCFVAQHDAIVYTSAYDAIVRTLDQPVQWVVIESCGIRAAHTEPFYSTDDAEAYVKAQRDAGYTGVDYLIVSTGTK